MSVPQDAAMEDAPDVEDLTEEQIEKDIALQGQGLRTAHGLLERSQEDVRT